MTSIASPLQSNGLQLLNVVAPQPLLTINARNQGDDAFR